MGTPNSIAMANLLITIKFLFLANTFGGIHTGSNGSNSHVFSSENVISLHGQKPFFPLPNKR